MALCVAGSDEGESDDDDGDEGGSEEEEGGEEESVQEKTVTTEEGFSGVAAAAEQFQPKGITLATTEVSLSHPHTLTPSHPHKLTLVIYVHTCEFLPLLFRSCPSLQRCCWKTMLLSLHPNIIVHVGNVVSLFSSPSISSQKVRKRGSHKFLDQILVNFYHCFSGVAQRCCWKMMLLSLYTLTL